MPPTPILDPQSLDFAAPLLDRDAILRLNPHRHEFQLLDAMVHLDPDQGTFAGYRDLPADDWWVRGHIPGRPLFPGVLMLESAAQACSIVYMTQCDAKHFMGFTGADDVKFRGTVVPPARYIVIGRVKQAKPRRFICDTQGFVGSEMVFHGEITGMPV